MKEKKPFTEFYAFIWYKDKTYEIVQLDNDTDSVSFNGINLDYELKHFSRLKWDFIRKYYRKGFWSKFARLCKTKRIGIIHFDEKSFDNNKEHIIPEKKFKDDKTGNELITPAKIIPAKDNYPITFKEKFENLPYSNKHSPLLLKTIDEQTLYSDAIRSLIGKLKINKKLVIIIIGVMVILLIFMMLSGIVKMG